MGSTSLIQSRKLLEQIVPEQPYSCKIDVHHNFLEKISTNQIDTLHQLALEQGIFPKTVPNDVLPNTQREQLCWIHRKGATPLTKSPILVLPGSRGTPSYLVEINPEIMHLSAYSVAHGAGRQLTRSKAKAMASARHSVQDLLQTEKGGIVVCEKKDIVFEEVPEAYKDIDAVVGCLAHEVYGERGGLVRVLATLRPLLTYKYKDPQGNSR
jgi:RNA-splicing ligase RtcB